MYINNILRNKRCDKAIFSAIRISEYISRHKYVIYSFSNKGVCIFCIMVEQARRKKILTDISDKKETLL